MDLPNPFRSLTAEWATLGRSPQARIALRRWSDAEPALAPFASPADAVAACQCRGDPRAANAVLGALLRKADDTLAARSVLQAVLPALAARAWRRRWDGMATSSEPALWDSVEDLDTEVLTFALERIAELAGTSPEWPAQAVVEVAWARFRWSAEVARRRRLDAVALDVIDGVATDSQPSAADELGELLLDSVRAGTVRRRDAALIFATRILGVTPAEVAEGQGRDVRAVRCQRARAERTLAAVAR